MVANAPGNASPGIAQGRIQINVAQATAAAQQFSQAARNMSASGGAIDRALGSIAQHFRQARDSAEAFKRTNLGQVQQGLQDTARSMGVLSAAAGALVAGGLAAARHIGSINTQFTVMLGSSKAAQRELDKLRQQADRTGQPFLQLADSASSLLSLSKANNLEVGKLVTLSQQLQAVDPTARSVDVSIASREFLSGNARSLFSRFEGLPKEELDAIAKGSKTAGERLEKLQALLERLGFSTKLLEQFGQQGAYAFEALSSEIQEGLATAFTPLLQDVVLPLVKGFTAFIRNLRETNPELLKIGSIFAVAAAAIAPLLLLLSQLITAYKTLKSVSSFALGGGVGGAIGKVAGGAAALGIGVDLGKRLVTGLGGAIANDAGLRNNADRLLGGVGSSSADLVRIGRGEDAGAVIGERLKQGIFIAVNLLLDGLKGIAQILTGGGNLIAQAIDLIVNAFKFGFSITQEIFGQFQEALAHVLLGISDLLYRLGLNDAGNAVGQAGTASLQAGFDTQNLARQNRLDAQQRLARGIDLGETQAAIDAVGTVFDGVKNVVSAGLLGLLFPVEAAAEDVEGAMTDAGDTIKKGGATLADNIAENADLLKKVQKDAKDLLDQFNEEVGKVTEERDLKGAREAFDRALQQARAARDLQKQLADQDAQFYKGRAETIRSHYAGIHDLETQALQQQAQQLADYREEDKRRAEDHGKRLAQIQEETRVAVEDAASRLDAAAVFNALTRGQEQVRQETDTFDTESQRRAEDFAQQQQQLVDNLAKQKAQRQSDFEQRLIDQLTAYQEQRAADAEARALRAADDAEDQRIREQRQVEDYAREDRLRQEAYSKRLQALVQQLTTEGSLNQAFIAQMQGVLGRSRNDLLGFYNYLNAITSALPGTTTTPRQAAAPPGRSVPTAFASGGVPVLGRQVRVNDGSGVESAYTRNQLVTFTSPARIFNAQQTAALLGGGGGNMTIGSVSPQIVLGDIGNHSEDTIRQLVIDGLMEALNQLPIPRRS